MLLTFKEHIKEIKTNGGKQHTLHYAGYTVKFIYAHQKKRIINSKCTKGINGIPYDSFCGLFNQHTKEESYAGVFDNGVNMQGIKIVNPPSRCIVSIDIKKRRD